MGLVRYEQRADVRTLSEGTADRLGVPRAVWGTTARRVPCRATQERRREYRNDAGETVVADWLIMAAAAPPWGMADRLVIDGVVYEPLDIDADVNRRGRHSETMCRVSTDIVP